MAVYQAELGMISWTYGVKLNYKLSAAIASAYKNSHGRPSLNALISFA